MNLYADRCTPNADMQTVTFFRLMIRSVQCQPRLSLIIRDPLNVIIERPAVYNRYGRLASGRGDKGGEERALKNYLSRELSAECANIHGLR